MVNVFHFFKEKFSLLNYFTSTLKNINKNGKKVNKKKKNLNVLEKSLVA